MRQAFAGMLWSKQLYYYDVRRWLDGDPGQPAPPASRRAGRNARWRSFNAFDIMSMPDKWEYPWFAAWDLAFHCVALAHVDPGFAKYQLTLLCREWFQHPNGALPAYEWDFGDVNPPVQAWAALEVFAIDGGRDIDFLSRVFDKLLVNFTWWVNLEDADGSNLFEGGFLGLDNIGPLDRSHLPAGQRAGAVRRDRVDGQLRAVHGDDRDDPAARPGSDPPTTWCRSSSSISPRSATRSRPRACGTRPTGCSTTARLRRRRGRSRSRCGRWSASSRCWPRAWSTRSCSTARRRRASSSPISWTGHGLRDREQLLKLGLLRGAAGTPAAAARRRRHRPARAAVREAVRSRRVPLPLRAALAVGLPPGAPLRPGRATGVHAEIDYEPAESTTAMFGGNSNWRGPVWFPLNYLVVAALERYHRFFGDDYTVEYPTGSGQTAAAGRRRPRPVGPADLDLPGRAGRAAAVLRLGGAPPARPALEGQHASSPSTSTATTAPGSGRPTRPGGPAWSPTSSGAATAR